MMTRLGISVLTLCIFASSLPAEDKANELKSLQGTWQVTKGSIGGREVSRDNAEDSRFTISGDTMTFESSRENSSARITVGKSSNLQTLDAEVLEGTDKGKKRLAIFELVGGDTLKIAFTRGEKRPEKLASAEGSDVIYLELKKQ